MPYKKLTMLLLVVLLLCASARGRMILEDPDCDGFIIRNIKYEEQMLKTGVDDPYHLGIDYDNDILFFSYQSRHSKSAYINLKTNESGIISGILGSTSNAVDRRNGTVYLGGLYGVYKFDADTKSASYLHLISDSIWQLFYKNVLYYIEYYTETAYKIVDGYPMRIPELSNSKAWFIAVDNNDNIYFANNSGLFYYKQDGGHIIKIGDYKLNGITSDVNGNIYFSTIDSLYYINDKAKQVETLATLDEHAIWGLAIESNGNIIVAKDNSILRLKPTEKRCIARNITKTFE